MLSKSERSEDESPEGMTLAEAWTILRRATKNVACSDDHLFCAAPFYPKIHLCVTSVTN